MIAVVGLTPGFQPCTVPSSVTNRKIACFPGVFPTAGVRRKSVALPLNNTPVGEPGAGWLGALGILTPFPGVPPGAFSGTMVTGSSTGGGVWTAGFSGFRPEVLYRVDVPPALFETHH